MNVQQALELLDAAPRGDGPSRINSIMTQTQAVELIRKGVMGWPASRPELSDLFEKRVHQVCQNQVRPRF